MFIVLALLSIVVTHYLLLYILLRNIVYCYRRGKKKSRRYIYKMIKWLSNYVFESCKDNIWETKILSLNLWLTLQVSRLENAVISPHLKTRTKLWTKRRSLIRLQHRSIPFFGCAQKKKKSFSFLRPWVTNKFQPLITSVWK